MIKKLSSLLSTTALAVVLTTAPVVLEAKQEATSVDSKEDLSETYKYLNLFGDVFERVQKEYVEDATQKELVEAAINGMLTHLDPHSGYLNLKDFKDMQVQTKGEFGGLGIEVTMENGLVKVVSPIDDTPAAEAGIEPGDYITQIDGESVMGLTLADAVDKMRGLVKTDIVITIAREGTDPFDLTITRDIIKIKAVKQELKKDIGYIRISSFNEQTTENLKKAFKKLQKNDKPLKGYVLDLRNNPGGLLDQAVSVSDAFLTQGEIVSTRGRSKEDMQRYNARTGDLANELPVVVLINGGSASASEIVAGALQDHRRAIVMGTKSFGKGSVQTIIPLSEEGAMRLTTARYYTPSGRSIQAKGIEPDIIVEQAKIETVEERFLRSEADLRGALKNPDKKLGNKIILKTEPANDNKKDNETAKKEEEEVDYQLARALDLINGLSLYQTLQPQAQQTAQKASP